MAKRKLTNTMIAFIVAQKDNPNDTATFEQISQRLAEVFGVKVSIATVGRAYRYYDWYLNKDRYKGVKLKDYIKISKKDNIDVRQ